MGKIALAAALVLVAGFVCSHRDWPRYQRLQRDGVRVEGWVIGKSSAKERLVHYAFQGPVKIVTAAGKAGYGNPEFDALQEGDTLIVYFLPSDPNQSCLGIPEERLREQHVVMVWLLLPAGIAAAWGLSRELKRAVA